MRRGQFSIDPTQYYGAMGYDLDKSAELDAYRKEYGTAMDNEIASEWQKAAVEKFGFNRMPVPQGNYMAMVQDEFLKKMKQRGLRNAYQKAKNPMLFGG